MVESAFDAAVSNSEHYVIVDGDRVDRPLREASPKPTAVPDAMLEYLPASGSRRASPSGRSCRSPKASSAWGTSGTTGVDDRSTTG